MRNLTEIIDKLATVNIEETNAVKLLKRYDSKYRLPIEKLFKILENIKDSYYILEIDGTRIQKYKTTYFDTADDKFYINHHNGRSKRLKIRKRQYVYSGIGFLEIKAKNNKGKTNKSRMQIQNTDDNFTAKEKEFLRLNGLPVQPFSIDNLQIRTINSFRRITLVNKDFNERCTIDLNLKFYSKHKNFIWDDLVIIELKQGNANLKTPLLNELKKQRIFKCGFSKYCIGRAIMDPQIKQNLFKAKLIQLEKSYKQLVLSS